MKPLYLFPHRLQVVGWLLAIAGFILGYLVLYQGFQIPNFGFPDKNLRVIASGYNNYTEELALMLVIAGLLLMGFSKTKHEDPEVHSLRLNSIFKAMIFGLASFTGMLIAGIYKTIVKGDATLGTVSQLFGNSLFIFHYLYLTLLLFNLRLYYCLLNKGNLPAVFQRSALIKHNNIAKWISIALLTTTVLIHIFLGTDHPALGIYYLLPVPLYFWVRSAEKVEDDHIHQIRLQAMHHAAYVTYGIMLLANVCLYSILFLYFSTINFILLPLVYLMIFKYQLRKAEKVASKSEIEIF